MHGNTFEASSGYKTRRFDDVIEEVQGFFDVHRASAPGPAASTSSSPATTSPSASAAARRSTRPGLGHRYESVCDPRLNRVQSLELSFLVAEMLRKPDPPGRVG